jgi:ubiquinone/menaquinone biosynthesis C-methylase UbiE
MIHFIKNNTVNWFLMRLKRLEYGKNYQKIWQERGGQLKASHDNSPVSEKYANQIADYIVEQVKGPTKILEYGCGFGRNIRKLEEKLESRCEIHGTDISLAALEEGANYTHGKAILQHVDGTKIPFNDDFFDFSFTSAVLEHIPNKDFEKICEEMIRVTRKTILHVEASRTYYTKFPHNYKKFYEKKGYTVKSFKIPGHDDTFTWYQIELTK